MVKEIKKYKVGDVNEVEAKKKFEKKTSGTLVLEIWEKGSKEKELTKADRFGVFMFLGSDDYIPLDRFKSMPKAQEFVANILKKSKKL